MWYVVGSFVSAPKRGIVWSIFDLQPCRERIMNHRLTYCTSACYARYARYCTLCTLKKTSEDNVYVLLSSMLS